jgi:hypothetical protein
VLLLGLRHLPSLILVSMVALMRMTQMQLSP